jgi:hypothetical protein
MTNAVGGRRREMSVKYDSTFQRVGGFIRIKSKPSKRALGGNGLPVQVSAFLHLRENGKPKNESDGSPGEVAYLLLVKWINDRAYLEMVRVDDGAPVAQAMGATEDEAWKAILRQIQLLDL